MNDSNTLQRGDGRLIESNFGLQRYLEMMDDLTKPDRRLNAVQRNFVIHGQLTLIADLTLRNKCAVDSTVTEPIQLDFVVLGALAPAIHPFPFDKAGIQAQLSEK